MFKHVVEHPCMTVRHLVKIIGTMVSCFLAVPEGRLYYRALERQKVSALSYNPSYEGQVTLGNSELECIHWWIHTIPRAIAPIRHQNPQISMTTDASGYAYGGCVNGMFCQGFFSERELPLSINTKETLDVWYSILSFRDILKGKHLMVFLDNVTAISYIASMGGMKSELRDKICKDIWTFVFHHNMWLSISFIPGRDNQDAYLASRALNPNTEFEISHDLFKRNMHGTTFFSQK